MGRRINKLLEIIFPNDVTCAYCNRELFDDIERRKGVCSKCDKAMLRTEENSKITIKNCDFIKSIFHYDNIIRQIVLSYKDSNKPHLATYMAKIFAEEYKNLGLICDYIVYVPSTATAIKRRGYDALGLVSEQLSSRLNLPVFKGVVKIKETIDQTKTDKGKRYENISGCFSLVDKTAIQDKSILLIDDCITTGATISEMSKVLKEGSPKAIKVLAFSGK